MSKHTVKQEATESKIQNPFIIQTEIAPLKKKKEEEDKELSHEHAL